MCHYNKQKEITEKWSNIKIIILLGCYSKYKIDVENPIVMILSNDPHYLEQPFQ